MHRISQLGARERPASDRRHDSRLAVKAVSGLHFIKEQNARTTANTQLVESACADAHSSPQADANHTATVSGTRDDGRLLTIRDVAELLQVPVSWVYEHTRQRSFDRMRGFRLGKYWRFNEADVRAWLRAKTQK